MPSSKLPITIVFKHIVEGENVQENEDVEPHLVARLPQEGTMLGKQAVAKNEVAVRVV